MERRIITVRVPSLGRFILLDFVDVEQCKYLVSSVSKYCNNTVTKYLFYLIREASLTAESIIWHPLHVATIRCHLLRRQTVIDKYTNYLSIQEKDASLKKVKRVVVVTRRQPNLSQKQVNNN